MTKPDTSPSDTKSTLWQLVLSIVLGVIGFGVCLGLLWVIGLILSMPNMVSGILDWLEKKVDLSSLAENVCSGKMDCWLVTNVRHVLWVPGVFIFIALAWKKGIARTVQRLFFLPFDLRTLRPINRYTGMLAWHPNATAVNSRHKAEFSQAQAWDVLLRAVTKDIGDGRWRSFWRRPALPLPFGWMVLAGPTGVGKTQLALELGRYLGRRSVLGDAGRSLPLSRRLA